GEEDGGQIGRVRVRVVVARARDLLQCAGGQDRGALVLRLVVLAAADVVLAVLGRAAQVVGDRVDGHARGLVGGGLVDRLVTRREPVWAVPGQVGRAGVGRAV